MDDSKQDRLRELWRDRQYEKELDEVLGNVGITYSEEFNLILHNDHINDMLHVVISLSKVCKVSIEKASVIMRTAHETGRSVIVNGNIDDLHFMRLSLESLGLTVSLEQAD
ncbi:MAG: ATP-dependent Clp protease adaptor ClpS [Bacteroidales bacterium]